MLATVLGRNGVPSHPPGRSGHVGAARQILRKLIPERLVFTPHTEGTTRYYTFEGVGRLEPLLQTLHPLER